MTGSCCRTVSLGPSLGQKEDTEKGESSHRPLGYTPVSKGMSSGDIERLNVGQIMYSFKELEFV